MHCFNFNSDVIVYKYLILTGLENEKANNKFVSFFDYQYKLKEYIYRSLLHWQIHTYQTKKIY
jgi:hypothetical protein